MQHVPQETPRSFMQKCTALQKMYSDSKDDLKQETTMITTKVVSPIETAKGCTKSMNRTLKHRENMKLDYERILGKVEHARKRTNPSPKEISTLERLEGDLAQQRIQYNTADQQIIETFPPVTDAVIALMPLLLAIIVELQTTLVGALYTNLDAYCRQQRIPSPAPGNPEIVSKWESEFTSLRLEIEQSFQTLKGGKAINMSMVLPPEKESTSLTSRIADSVPGRKPKETAVLPIRSQGASNQLALRPDADEDEEEAPPKPPRPPMARSVSATSSAGTPPPIPGGKPPPPVSRAVSSSYLTPHNAPYDQKSNARMPVAPYASQNSLNENYAATPPSRYATPSEGYGASPGRLSPAASTTGDYFGAAQQVRRTSTNTISSTGSGGLTPGQYTPGLEEILAAKAKKKPPPPVPSKPKPKPPVQAQYVIALYDFEGQNPEDLPFREGDRIRVTKKTASTDDWWDGELNGRKGTFPANYVQL